MVRGRRGRVKNGTMSANGTMQTCSMRCRMSALGGITDVDQPLARARTHISPRPGGRDIRLNVHQVCLCYLSC